MYNVGYNLMILTLRGCCVLKPMLACFLWLHLCPKKQKLILSLNFDQFSKLITLCIQQFSEQNLVNSKPSKNFFLYQYHSGNG